MMGLDNMSALAHSVEDLFYIIRERKIEIIDNDLLFDLVFQALDFIKYDIGKLQSGDCTTSDCSSFIKDIEDYVSTLELSSSTKLQDKLNLEDTYEKEITNLNFLYREGSDIVKIVLNKIV